jgi:hypothetical protein
MPQRPPPPHTEAAVHLYRGAPPARSWSRYQKTIREWSLCGIQSPASPCVEDAAKLTCRYCRQLLAPARTTRKPEKSSRAQTTNA